MRLQLPPSGSALGSGVQPGSGAGAELGLMSSLWRPGAEPGVGIPQGQVPNGRGEGNGE